EWSKDHSMVLYPYTGNNYIVRSHDQFIAVVKEASRNSTEHRPVVTDEMLDEIWIPHNMRVTYNDSIMAVDD
ncbi:unnamed protein product, partial [Didymodactylos carnosus]